MRDIKKLERVCGKSADAHLGFNSPHPNSLTKIDFSKDGNFV